MKCFDCVLLRRLVAAAWAVALALGTIARPVLAAPPPPGQLDGALPRPEAGDGVRAIGNPMPAKGEQKLLVVLADFPDRGGIFTQQAWRNDFFSGSTGFGTYFQQISGGLLRYTADVVGVSGGAVVGNSSTVAYVRLPNAITYYAGGSFGFYGAYPNNNSGVVNDALAALDGAGFDFTPYADAGTKNVRNLIVIFAGRSYGYTGNGSNSLEATGYRLLWGKGAVFTSSSGFVLDNYTFCPEQTAYAGALATIGICAHEHGHSLGAPDLYDLSYLTTGVGRFDLMGYGLYGGGSGARPFHPGAFTKEYVGWANYPIPPYGTITVTLPAAETGLYGLKLAPPGNSQEYFLLENRQPTLFDQDWTAGGSYPALCAGLVIWHVDQQIVQAYALDDKVNTTGPGGPPHQGAIVVEADGGTHMISPPLSYGACADTWITGQSWGPSTTPSSHLWNGSASGLAVTVLAQNADGSLQLRVTESDPARVYTYRRYLALVMR